MRKLAIVLVPLLVLALVVGVVGCGGEKAPTATPTPTPIPTPTPTPTSPPTPTPTPQETIRVMTYNILNGAGVEAVYPSNKEWTAQHQPGYPGNRLQKVLNVIRAADPDVLGVQEAHQWEIGSPCTAEQVADELDMNYFIGESTNPESGFGSVVLFTKFDIVETESYSPYFSRAALRAKIITPSGKSIHVFVAHLNPYGGAVAEAETESLVDKMQPYIDDLTILMGDLNFLDVPSQYQQAALLHQAGWCHPLSSIQYIDQVWTSPMLEHFVQPGLEIPSEFTYGASDHLPVVVEVGIP